MWRRLGSCLKFFVRGARQLLAAFVVLNEEVVLSGAVGR